MASTLLIELIILMEQKEFMKKVALIAVLIDLL